MIRSNPLQESSEFGRRWRFGDCEFIEIRRQLLVHGEPVKLESKPLDVLQHLLENPGQIITKDELIGAAWDTSTTDQSLATAISKLRKAFGGPRDAVILNVSGVGYRMAVPVMCTVVDEPASVPFLLKAGDFIPGRPHWRTLKQLGMGTPHPVWLGEHSKTHENRVFKFAVDGVRLQALQREVTLSRLFQKSLAESRGFVQILDWDFENEPFFIESEYCSRNLFEWAQTEEFARLSLLERVALAAQLAETVASAHALGILHNDLKPANVLVSARTSDTGIELQKAGEDQAENWQMKVADFGVASISNLQRVAELQITHYGSFEEPNENDGSGTPVGTAMYRAPELLAGTAPSIRGDVYALGVMLYQIVCGDFLEPPSVGWGARIFDPILREDIAAAANIDPSRRMSSAAELAERLRSIEKRRAERKERASAIAAAEQARQEIERARLRQPWLILAVVALLAGLCASLWFYHRATHERDLANSRNETLSAMNDFLSDDLLGQNKPFREFDSSGNMLQETLVEALKRGLLQVDRRFSKAPEIAGGLHQVIARALSMRMESAEADREFKIAIQRFKEAEGPLSQNAIITELRREDAEISNGIPGAVQDATKCLEQQQQLISRLHDISPELQASLVVRESNLTLAGPHPEQWIHPLEDAISRAEATPNFNPLLLINLKRHLYSAYSSDEPGHAEQVIRETISYIQTMRGSESPVLFTAYQSLEDVLGREGKFSEALAQANQNYTRLSKLSGPKSQSTLYAWRMRVRAEEMAEDYDAAIRDGLALDAAEALNPPSKWEDDPLHVVAKSECYSGRFDSGLNHARQLIRGRNAISQPESTKLGTFIVAECMIAQAENSESHRNTETLNEIDRLLKMVDIPRLAQTPEQNDIALAHILHQKDIEGIFYVAEARLALLRGQPDIAKEYADKAAPFMGLAYLDPYEKKAFAKLQTALTHVSPQKP
jgi:eukaryotic-like serine/threonine-protein kinase